MKQRIAVEPSLTPVRDFLTDKGYQVESMSLTGKTPTQTDKFDAFIVTGMNTNLMGIHDTETKALVIDATGLTAEQVYHQLEERLR